MTEPLIFERSVSGRRGYRLSPSDVPTCSITQLLPQDQRRTDALPLPELSEFDVVRHFTRISQLNFSVDTHCYPLGSCTMKYNPKLNDRVAAMPAFAWLHPFQPADQLQGILRCSMSWSSCCALLPVCLLLPFSLPPGLKES